LEPMTWELIDVYLDNIIIHSRTLAEFAVHVYDVLTLIMEYGL
jgi:hypothetical protein